MISMLGCESAQSRRGEIFSFRVVLVVLVLGDAHKSASEVFVLVSF